MLVYTHQKNIAQVFILERYFFSHLFGSNSQYLLNGVLGGSAAALFITSDIYSKKLDQNQSRPFMHFTDCQ